MILFFALVASLCAQQHILIIGSGAREHALAWKCAQSEHVAKVYIATGNAGTAREPKVENVDIGVTEVTKLAQFAHCKNIDLTIAGPEAALDAGIVDIFQTYGLRCFGPTKQAAKLETSKLYAKEFMIRHTIPTARFAYFDEIQTACDYIARQQVPLVIKADGLAGGKGVIIAHTHEDARAAAYDMLVNKIFGKSGERIIIEEFLAGEEATFIVMTDGKTILPLAATQDHKKRDNGEQGPNTGGMGAYSPTSIITPELHEKILRTIIEPTLAGLREEGIEYRGFLYAGLMILPDKSIKVLEYNCRLGDPEAQVILMRMQSDLVELCLSTFNGTLKQKKIEWDPRPAITVVLASQGYPEKYQTDKVITGLSDISETVKIFHAATKQKDDKVVTSGGRVLCVTTLADTICDARNQAYQAIDTIHYENKYCRTDIAARSTYL